MRIGILTQAQKAKEETENAQREEDAIINQYESYINQVTNTEAVVGEIVTGGNKPYTNNGTAIIPEGFMIVPGLDNVEEGLVISDNASDTEKEGETLVAEGNQFVWVPVPDFDEFKRHDFGNQGIPDENFVTDQLTENKYYEPTADGIANETEVEKMYKSVKDNKGFYIGRYEAGNDGLDNAISKKNQNPYINIKWGNSIYDETGGAVEKARNFDTQSGHTNVSSTLVYSVQWDAVMRWLSNGTEEEQELLINSTSKGNYYDNDDTNNPAKTGAVDSYQIKNIYDLAGNVSEVTMELRRLTNEPEELVVHRGGNYAYNNGVHYPCTFRNYGFLDDEVSNNRGFRIALYL